MLRPRPLPHEARTCSSPRASPATSAGHLLSLRSVPSMMHFLPHSLCSDPPFPILFPRVLFSLVPATCARSSPHFQILHPSGGLIPGQEKGRAPCLRLSAISC